MNVKFNLAARNGIRAALSQWYKTDEIKLDLSVKPEQLKQENKPKSNKSIMWDRGRYCSKNPLDIPYCCKASSGCYPLWGLYSELLLDYIKGSHSQLHSLPLICDYHFMSDVNLSIVITLGKLLKFPTFFSCL